MTPEAQRIAIAEACPKVFNIVQTTFNGRQVHWRLNDGCDGIRVDPLSDLNAMHQAEETLTHTQRENYSNALSNLLEMGYCGEYDAIESFNCYHATAAQRAEAFLRSLNLFE